MNIDQAFPKNHLNAKDLVGRRVPVTIKDVTMEDMDDGTKPVMSFHGKEKTLVLNRTNANRLIEILGSDETTLWRGRQVVLTTEKTDYQGRRVDAIRIQAADAPGFAPSAPAPAPEPSPVPPVPAFADDIPF